MSPEITADRRAAVDRDDMWGHLIRFPDHWRETMEFTRDANWSIERDRIRNICLCGMGGSAIGADLARGYTLKCSRLPVSVIRNYEVPGWVGEETLFVACSYSGNTEETLNGLEQARHKGAQIVAVTSGGRLLVEASGEGYGYVKIPGGMPPRAALAYSFVPLFRLFSHLGINDEGERALEETADLLEEQVELMSGSEDNQALLIAREIQDTLPIVYTGHGLLAPVGRRWLCQFGENAKILSHGNTVPEMNHNEIVGWEQTAHLTGRLSVILLQDKSDHPKVAQRLHIVREMVEDLTVYATQLRSIGKSRLARQFSLVQLGDWVSIYLALLNNVDPTPIPKIDLLKSRLAEL